MATIRDNDFTLKMTGMSDMEFDISGHSITSGQPWEGISKISCNSSGDCTMTVRAGRKGSKNVAQWFKDNVDGGSALGCSTIDQMPSELNFAFIGTMTFSHGGKTYTGTDIVIAQGHGGGRNNWWIGGKEMAGLTIPVLGGGIGQTFTQNHLPLSKVGFVALFGQISNMSMALVAL